MIFSLCFGISSSTVYPHFAFFFCLFVCTFWWCFNCLVVLIFLSYKFLYCTFGYWLRYFYFSALCTTTEAESDEEEVLICYKKFRSHEERPKVVVLLWKMVLGRFLLKGLFLLPAFFNASSDQPIATCNNCCRRGNHKEMDNSRWSVRSQWKWCQTPLCDKGLPQG